MQIYFTGAVRGGRSHIKESQFILENLKKYGDVFGSQITDESISDFGETHLSSEEILEREKENILDCDLVVAEVSTPSLGVGYLLSFASLQNKKILVFYKGENNYKLSAIIKGDKNILNFIYETGSDIETIIKENLV